MDLPKRKSIRLKEYDYSQAGLYFITICTHNRMNVLSRIVGGDFQTAPQTELTTLGKEVAKTIDYMTEQYPDVVIDKYVIMPNHIHLIVGLQQTQTGGHGNPPLPQVVGQLKSYTTKMYNTINKTQDYILWQRGYHDHIIRNQDEYREIWEYIDVNPLKWELDRYYK